MDIMKVAILRLSDYFISGKEIMIVSRVLQ